MVKPRCGKGFTLIEVVIVIVLLMVLAAAAIPRVGNMSGAKAAAAARKLQSDIAYAQQLAMVSNQRYRVYFNTAPAPGSGYAVVNEAGQVIPDPVHSGATLSVALNTGTYAGIVLSASLSYIEFNTLGVPFNEGAPLGAAASVSVTGGGVSKSVTVQPVTGNVGLQ